MNQYRRILLFPDMGKRGMQGGKESEISILAASRSSSNRGNLTTELEEIVRVYVCAAEKKNKQGGIILLIQNHFYLFDLVVSFIKCSARFIHSQHVVVLYFVHLAQNQLFRFVSTSTWVLGMLVGRHQHWWI